MNLEQFKKYLINQQNIYPDYCKKENILYKNYEVYSPQFNEKDIGLPIFYLIDKKDNIINCNKEQIFEILKLLEKSTNED